MKEGLMSKSNYESIELIKFLFNNPSDNKKVLLEKSIDSKNSNSIYTVIEETEWQQEYELIYQSHKLESY